LIKIILTVNPTKLDFNHTVFHRVSSETVIYQDVPVYPGEPLTFSGMVKTSNVAGGNGAYFKVEFYHNETPPASPTLIGDPIQTGYVLGTQDDFVKLTTLANAPSGASFARIYAILDGIGTAYFDCLKLIPCQTQKFTYNTNNNYITEVEDPMANTVQYQYNDQTGWKVSATDACNHTTLYGNDVLDRLTSVRDPLLHIAYYDYDANSNLTAIRGLKSSGPTDDSYKTDFVPTELNVTETMTERITDTSTATESYEYDRSGNLSKVTKPSGAVITYQYNGANQLSGKSNGIKPYTFTYDGANNLSGVNWVDWNTLQCEAWYWERDGAGRVNQYLDAFGYNTHYTWDKSSNLLSITGRNNSYQYDGTIQYAYGSDNRLLSVAIPGEYNISYDYTESKRLFQVKYPGTGNARIVTYNPNGWCTSIQDKGFPNQHPVHYTYYDNGQIHTMTTSNSIETYYYDDNGRLERWDNAPYPPGSTTTELYEYDAAGNLTRKGNFTYQFNNANQIINPGFTYNLNGNLTCDGIYKYTYDSKDHLTEVRRASDNVLVATYTYSFDGLRKSKTVYTGQSQLTTNFHWDTFGNLIRESDTSGQTTCFYYYSPNGNLVGLKKNGQTYIIHNNQRGDVVSITDVNGNIVNQYHYDPWGNIISSSGTLSQPFRYAGYYFDEETGLYYLKSRYYSPTLGRFLTKDGIGYIRTSDPRTLNLYAYVGNDPVNKTDPNGNYMPGDENLSQEVQEEIETVWGPMYNAAKAVGDNKKMEYAHAQANALRNSASSFKVSWTPGSKPTSNLIDYGIKSTQSLSGFDFTAGGPAAYLDVDSGFIIGGQLASVGVEKSFTIPFTKKKIKVGAEVDFITASAGIKYNPGQVKARFGFGPFGGQLSASW
jgi:RHS repeat-associated protein